MRNRVTGFLVLIAGLIVMFNAARIAICAPEPPGVPAVKGVKQSRDRYASYLLINFYLHQKDYVNAESEIDGYLKNNPYDPFVLTEKALMLRGGSDNIEEALKLLEKAKVTYPSYYFSNYVHAVILFSRFGHHKAKVDRAIKYLELAIKDNPGFFESYFLMGAILSDREQFAESNKYLEKALRIKRSVKAYLYLAANYRQLKDLEGEVAAYKKLLEFSPYNYSALSTLSKYYLEKKQFKKAVRFLEKLFTRTPDNPQVSSEYLYALFAAGEIEKFKEVSGQVDISSNPMLLYAKALVLSRERKYDEAERLLKTLGKGDVESYLLLSEIYLRKQDYYRALRTLDKVSSTEHNFHYFLARLQTLSLLNLNTRTVELFDRMNKASASKPPLTLGSYYTVMFAYADLNRPGKIKETAALALAKLNKENLSPEDIETLRPLRDLNTLLKDFEPGKVPEPGKLGVELAYDRNFYLILTIYKKNNRYGHAESLLDRLIKKDNTFKQPGNEAGNDNDNDNASPDLYLELCEIYQEQKRFGEAEKLLKRLIKRFPQSMRVKNFYAYFLVEQNRDLEYALELSAYTLDKDRDNPAYLDTYGFILFRMGRVAEAEKYLEDAHKKLPFEKDIMEHLAACYRVKKKHGRIILMYQKAIDIGVDYKEALLKELEVLKRDTKTK